MTIQGFGRYLQLAATVGFVGLVVWDAIQDGRIDPAFLGPGAVIALAWIVPALTRRSPGR